MKYHVPQQIGFKKVLAISLLLCAGFLSVFAQTHAIFQNCQLGDNVIVKCDHPLLVLGKATLLEIGSNTVTVCTVSDRFTLDQTNITLIPLANRPASAAAQPGIGANSTISPAGQTKVVPVADSIMATDQALAVSSAQSPAEILKTMESVRASVIDPHKMEAYKEQKLVNGHLELVVDPNSPNGKAKYDKANDDYKNTMNGVINGNITQSDLVQQAKKMLTDCEKYVSERNDDPQYENKIQTLRDFVRRSEAGEKIIFGKPIQ